MSIKDKAKRNAYNKAYVAKNPEKVKVWRRKAYANMMAKPGYHLWHSAKSRAKKAGIEFTIDREDIIIPEYCPVFPWIKLEKSPYKNHVSYSSPTIDRFDNSRGYTKDNIRVISMKANNRKSDMTIEEVECLLRYMSGGANG